MSRNIQEMHAVLYTPDFCVCCSLCLEYCSIPSSLGYSVGLLQVSAETSGLLDDSLT